jgi:hypothetical protein
MHMCDCEFCDWCGDEEGAEKNLRQRQFIRAAMAYLTWHHGDEADLKDLGRAAFQAAEDMPK